MAAPPPPVLLFQCAFLTGGFSQNGSPISENLCYDKAGWKTSTNRQPRSESIYDKKRRVIHARRKAVNLLRLVHRRGCPGRHDCLSGIWVL